MEITLGKIPSKINDALGGAACLCWTAWQKWKRCDTVMRCGKVVMCNAMKNRIEVLCDSSFLFSSPLLDSLSANLISSPISSRLGIFF